jgi:hypothetical protein
VSTPDRILFNIGIYAPHAMGSSFSRKALVLIPTHEEHRLSIA